MTNTHTALIHCATCVLHATGSAIENLIDAGMVTVGYRNRYLLADGSDADRFIEATARDYVETELSTPCDRCQDHAEALEENEERDELARDWAAAEADCRAFGHEITDTDAHCAACGVPAGWVTSR